MERFVIIVKGFQLLTIITKPFILDVAAALDPPHTQTLDYSLIYTIYKFVYKISVRNLQWECPVMPHDTPWGLYVKNVRSWSLNVKLKFEHNKFGKFTVSNIYSPEIKNQVEHCCNLYSPSFLLWKF